MKGALFRGQVDSCPSVVSPRSASRPQIKSSSAFVIDTND